MFNVFESVLLLVLPVDEVCGTILGQMGSKLGF